MLATTVGRTHPVLVGTKRAGIHACRSIRSQHTQVIIQVDHNKSPRLGGGIECGKFVDDSADHERSRSQGSAADSKREAVPNFHLVMVGKLSAHDGPDGSIGIAGITTS